VKTLINRSRLEQILSSLSRVAIGVLGDFTLDGYWHADMQQSLLSRETPLYPRPVVREAYSLGGAANTAWNLADLGTGRVEGFSVTGSDWRGAILSELLAKSHIQTGGFITQPDRCTPFFGKIILTAPGRHFQEDARLDFINTQPLSPQTEQALLERLGAAMDTLDGLIVADYQSSGVVTPYVAEGLREIARRSPGKPIIVDSRERSDEFRQFILKPNDSEAARLFFPQRSAGQVSQAELATAALQHTAQTDQPVIITLGAQGCLVCALGALTHVPGVGVPSPIDTVGAGDAFLAAFTAAYAARASAVEAACLANLAAAVTVTKLGITGTASPAEVLAMYERWTAQPSSREG